VASRFGWQLLFIGCLIRSANEIKNSAGDIRKAVEKLEAIFDRMYTDTFGRNLLFLNRNQRNMKGVLMS